MTRIDHVIILAGTWMLACLGCAGEAPPKSQPVELVYVIKGMHCSGCVDAITLEVNEIEGVNDCQVDLDRRSAVILADNPSISGAILESVGKLGYDITGVDAPVHPPDTTTTEDPLQENG
ncbi:MAG: hypothetical protein CMJ32_09215 [Phycisphaerae bacterium]|nr:hypothetical protein [Phycisphaerae bacterium]